MFHSHRLGIFPRTHWLIALLMVAATLAGAPAALAMPDLRFVQVDAPSSAPRGATVTMAVRIENFGSTASNATTYTISIGQRPVLNEMLGPIQPGPTAGQTIVRQVRIPLETPVGITTLRFFADPFGALESPGTGQDNTADRSLNVTEPGSPGPGAAPDLSVLDLIAPPGAAIGATVPMTAVVRNVGTTAAAGTSAHFFLRNANNDVFGLGMNQVPTLLAQTNAQVPLQANLSNTLAPGQYAIGVRVDAPQGETPATTSNNIFVRTALFSVTSGAPASMPNLIVESVFATPSATSGRHFGVGARIRNGGTQGVPGYAVMFALSANGILDDADRPFEPPVGRPGLAAGQASAFTTSVLVPAIVSPGSYFVFAVADPDGRITESNEADNTRSTTTPTQITGSTSTDFPDLVPNSITFMSPTTPVPGARLNVTLSVSNPTNFPSGPYATQLFLSVDTLFNAPSAQGGDIPLSMPIDRPGLGAGGSDAFMAATTIPPGIAPGEYFLLGLVDVKQQVGETNEGNNVLASPNKLFVRPPPQQGNQPDLVAESVSAVTTGAAGRPLGLSAGVRNGGTANSTGFAVDFFLSQDAIFDGAAGGAGTDPFLTSTLRPPLAVGAFDQFTTAPVLPQFIAQGQYFVLMAVDPFNRISETDERNNFRASFNTTPIAGGGSTQKTDLAAQSVAAAPTATAGQQLRLSALVSNVSQVPASGYPVRFFLSQDQRLDLGTSAGGGDRPLGEPIMRPSLAANMADSFDHTALVPADVAPGDYFVLMFVDPGNGLPEILEDNNIIASANLTHVGSGDPVSNNLPDLIAVSTSGTPVVTAGGPIELGVTVRNGTPIGAGPFGVSWNLEPVPKPGETGGQPVFLADRRLAGVAGNTHIQTSTRTFVPAAIAGNFFLRADVDYRREVAEGNETNNVLRAQSTIQVNQSGTQPGGQIPDLIVEFVSGGSQAVIGQPYPFNARIRNVGTARAGAFKVSFGFSVNQFPPQNGARPYAGPFGEFFAQGLDAGASLEAFAVATVPRDLPPGTYYPAAGADDPPQVPESIESNNFVVAPAAVVASSGGAAGGNQPDLVAASVSSLTTRTQAGQQISLHGALRNFGTAPARGYTFSFLLDGGTSPNGPTPPIFLRELRGPEIASGAGFDITTSALVPAGAPSGFYMIRLDVDPQQTVPESNEFNNSRYSERPVEIGSSAPNTQLPNIQLSNLEAPPSATLNTTMAASVQVNNTGTVKTGPFSVAFMLLPDSATSNFGEGFFLSEVRLDNGFAPSAGARVGGRFFLPGYLAPGAYKVVAEADMQRQVNESNENDNRAAFGSITQINPGDGGTPGTNVPPNLRAVSLTGPLTAAAGGRLTLNAVVENTADGFAAGFSTGFVLLSSLEDLALAERGTQTAGFHVIGNFPNPEGLAGHRRFVIDATFPVPLAIAPGQYLLAMKVDEDERIPETNEDDNKLLAANRVTVFGGGAAGELDLIAGNTLAPATATIGASINVTANFVVKGLRDPIKVPVYFFFSSPGFEYPVFRTFTPVVPAGSNADSPASTTVRLQVPQLPLPAPGTNANEYSIVFVLDPQFSISEPHHNNRSLDARMTISGGAGTGIPNLVADFIGNPPPTLSPGLLLPAAGRVSNPTQSGVFSPFGVTFHLLQEQAIGTSAAPPAFFLGRQGFEGIPANGQLPIAASYPVPGFLRPGSYKLAMRVDEENLVRESNEADNFILSQGSSIVGTGITRVTDLVALGVGGPTAIELGGRAAVYGQIANRGENDAPGFPVSFVLSPSQEIGFGSPFLGIQFVPGLSAGATVTLTESFPVPFYLKPGAYYLGMLVDSGSFVPETDERNNVARSQFPIAVQSPTAGGLQADLAAISVAARGPRMEKNEAEPGELLQVSGQVENLTTQPVPVDFRVAFFATRGQILQDDLANNTQTGFDIGSIHVGGIGAGEVREVRLNTNVPPFARPGDYYIGMFVDPDQRIPEAAETRGNNKVLSLEPIGITTAAFFKETPELIAINVTGQSTGAAGRPYAINWSMRAENVRRPIAFDVLFLARPNDANIDASRGVNIQDDGQIGRYLPIGRTRVAYGPGSPTDISTSTTIRLPGDLAAGSYSIAMAIDPENAVAEYDKENNFRENRNPVSISGGQAEADDHVDARLLVRDPEDRAQPGRTVEAAIQFKQGGDTDWFFFDAEQDKFYLLEFKLGSLVDAELGLFDRDGRDLRHLRADGTGSRVSFRATYNGRYFMRVNPTFPFQTGSYGFRLEAFQIDQGQPDLLPGPVSVTPIVATSSSQLTAHFSIGNGSSADAGPFAWQLRVERHVEDGNNLLFRPVAEATVIATGTMDGLRAFSSRPVTPPVKFGPLPDGKYDIVLTVDSNFQVAETDEGNNSRPSPFFIGRGDDGFEAHLDLVPAGIGIDPQRPTTSSNILAKLAVANRGGLPATTFAVSVYLDRTAASPGTLLTTLTIEHIAPDSVRPLPPVTVGRLGEGQHNLVMVVDSEDAVSETVEENNQRLHEFYVRGSVPSGYDLVPERAAVLPEYPTTGTPVALALYIANRGSDQAPASLVRVYVDPVTGADGTLASNPVTSVAVGLIGSLRGTRVGPVELPSFTTSGKHKILVRIDGTDASNVEVNTSNNQITLEVGVTEKRFEASFLQIRGRVFDGSGSPVPDRYRVRAYNKARRARSSESTTPQLASQSGSYIVTFGSLGTTRLVISEGDSIEFKVVSDLGEKLPVSDPTSVVVTAGDITSGGLDVDLHTAPAEKQGVAVTIDKPDDGAVFQADDTIVFQGNATDGNGMRLLGPQLVWKSGTLYIGSGESFATTLPAGRHELTLSATAANGTTGIARRTIEVQTPEVTTISALTILGELKSVQSGGAPTQTLRLTIRNDTRGLEAETLIEGNGDGRYSVDFTDPDATGGVAEPGDHFKATLEDLSGNAVPISPGSFSIGSSDLRAGQHERDFRVHYEDPVTETYFQGTNLVSVPLKPFSEDGTAYDSEDLARDLGVTFLVRIILDENGEPKFSTYISGLNTAFPIEGNEAYLANLTADRTIAWQGIQWESESIDVKLTRGLNSISNALDVPEGLTVRQVLEQFGAKIAVAVQKDGNNTTFQLLGEGFSDLDQELEGIKLFVISPVDTPAEIPAVQ